MTPQYTYKVYNGSEYLGNLPAPADRFRLPQEINTAGSQITITVPLSIDTAEKQSSGTIQDETGADLLTEANDPLFTEGAVPAVALGVGGALIKNGNIVVVIEQSLWHPNGRVVFRGIMEKWTAAIGGSIGSDSIKVTCYSDGSDMDNYLLYGPVTYTLNVDHGAGTLTSQTFVNEASNGYTRRGQTFTVAAGVTNFGAISFFFTGTAHVKISVYASHTGSPPLLASTRKLVSGANKTEVRFTLNASLAATPGQTFFALIQVDPGESINVWNSPNAYAGGTAYQRSKASNSNTVLQFAQTPDLAFRTYATTNYGQTKATFNSLDPASGMLVTFMDDYINRGGKIVYAPGSIVATGQSLSITMQTNTILEGIKAMLTLAPGNYYWYVDIGTNVLYFKPVSTTADIILTRGVEIGALDLGASIEDVANNHYGSFGEISPGVNLYKYYQDQDSINLYGPRLNRISDNRVTVTATADAIGSSALSERKDEEFETTVTVSEYLMDPADVHVGLLVGFRGYGTFVDTLLMQIVRFEREDGVMTLTLGKLPKRQSSEIERLTRELLAEQTVANPTTPS